jgi:hypothetical protein
VQCEASHAVKVGKLEDDPAAFFNPKGIGRYILFHTCDVPNSRCPQQLTIHGARPVVHPYALSQQLLITSLLPASRRTSREMSGSTIDPNVAPYH